jgi:hypothetical protein
LQASELSGVLLLQLAYSLGSALQQKHAAAMSPAGHWHVLAANAVMKEHHCNKKLRAPALHIVSIDGLTCGTGAGST